MTPPEEARTVIDRKIAQAERNLAAAQQELDDLIRIRAGITDIDLDVACDMTEAMAHTVRRQMARLRASPGGEGPKGA